MTGPKMELQLLQQGARPASKRAIAKAWLAGWASGPRGRNPYKRWTAHNAWTRGRAAAERENNADLLTLAAYIQIAGERR